MHHHTKFHQYQSNTCGDNTFNGFQDSSHLSFWIFKNQRADLHHHADIVKINRTALEILYFSIFKMAAIHHAANMYFQIELSIGGTS